MSKTVQMTLSSAFVSDIKGTRTQVRVSDGFALPTFAFRNKTKVSKCGYGTTFVLNESGEAVIRTPLETFLKEMNGMEPVAGTYYLKDITLDRYLAVKEIKAVKEGKKPTVNPAHTVTIEVLDTATDQSTEAVEAVAETTEVEQPAE
jgi:hypothetical protein